MPRTLRDNPNARDVVVLIDDPSRLRPVLGFAYLVASSRDERVHALVVGDSDHLPDWFALPAAFDRSRIHVESVGPANLMKNVLSYLKPLTPRALFVGLTNEDSETRFLLNETLDPIVHRVRCPVALVKASPDWDLPQHDPTIFVPLWGDPGSTYAIKTALAVNPTARITAGISAASLAGDPDAQDYKEQVERLAGPWREDERVRVVIVEGDEETEALRKEARRHDFSLLGAPRGNAFLRAIFGDPRHKFLSRNPGPTVVVREFQGKMGTTLFELWSRWERLLPNLNSAERKDVYRQVRRAGRPTRDFFTMIALSAGIASLGLILASPAVIIGAMLVAPLMGAIIGMGMAVIHGDLRFLMTCGEATFKGAFIAIVTGVLIGILALADEPTSEMLGRAEPNHLDLAVALVSGFAAAYALSRKDVSNALPGVAIAVALVPPLATTGVSLALGEWRLAWGSLLLFLTNLAAITFASAAVFAALGFRPTRTQMADSGRSKITERSFLTSAVLLLTMGLILAVQTADYLDDKYDREVIEALVPSYLDSINVRSTLLKWQLEPSPEGAPGELILLLNATRALGEAESIELGRRLSDALGRDLSLKLSVLPMRIIPAE